MPKRILNLLLLVSLFLVTTPHSAVQAAPATGRHSPKPISAFMVAVQENERLGSLARPTGATNESASQPTAETGVFAERGIELLGQLGSLATAVAIQGNYAYVGVGPRLVILDLSTPNNPVAVGQTGLLPNTVADVFVAGAYAFVADAWAGLRIIDVADPTAPHEVGY